MWTCTSSMMSAVSVFSIGRSPYDVFLKQVYQSSAKETVIVALGQDFFNVPSYRCNAPSKRARVSRGLAQKERI